MTAVSICWFKLSVDVVVPDEAVLLVAVPLLVDVLEVDESLAGGGGGGGMPIMPPISPSADCVCCWDWSPPIPLA